MGSRLSGILRTGSDIGKARTHLIPGRFGEAGASRGRATRPAGSPSRFLGDTIPALRAAWLPLCKGGGSRPRPGVLPGGNARPRQDGAGLRATRAQGERREVDRQLPFGAAASGGGLGTQSQAPAGGLVVQRGIVWRRQRRICTRHGILNRRISRFLSTAFAKWHARRSSRFSATCCWTPPGWRV